MRVSATVRDYIKEEVKKRLMPKYEAEKAEAQRRIDIRESILSAAAEAAELAWETSIDEALADLNEDFLEDKRNEGLGNRPTFYNLHALMFKDSCYTSSVHRWQDRLYEEARKITKEILVELELGGTKADLERLLNNVGKD